MKNDQNSFYSFPPCKQQREFEDLAKELVNILSELDEQRQIEIFEFAQCVYTDKENKWKNWRNQK